jgi:hypothetical protein
MYVCICVCVYVCFMRACFVCVLYIYIYIYIYVYIPSHASGASGTLSDKIEESAYFVAGVRFNEITKQASCLAPTQNPLGKGGRVLAVTIFRACDRRLLLYMIV